MLKKLDYARQMEKMKEWQSAKAELDFYRKREAELRSEIIGEHSTWTDPLAEGTETVPYGSMTIKIGHGVDYKLEGTEQDMLSLRGKVAEIMGQALAERLIVFKPALVLSEYRRADRKAVRLIEKVLTRKAKTKSLELK